LYSIRGSLRVTPTRGQVIVSVFLNFLICISGCASMGSVSCDLILLKIYLSVPRFVVALAFRCVNVIRVYRFNQKVTNNSLTFIPLNPSQQGTHYNPNHKPDCNSNLHTVSYRRFDPFPHFCEMFIRYIFDLTSSGIMLTN